MPITLPTRAEILEQIKADIRLELGVDPMRRSPEYALARALTGQSKGQYGALARNYRDAFPDTASEEAFWHFATLWITQLEASPWRGIYRISGTDGTIVAQGRPISRSDGQVYTTDVAVEIGEDVTGYVDVAVTASTAGATANNDDGQPMALSSPLVGALSAGTVQSTTVDGAEVETAEEGLVRLLEVLRSPPRGGGPGDYVRWAKEVSGVTRAWEFANLYGPNTVGVAFVRDNDVDEEAPDYNDIVPSAGEIAEVQAYMDAHAPITVAVTVITLVAQEVDYEITDLEPDDAETRTAIEAELADFHTREGEPGGTLSLSRINAAISGAVPELSHELTDPVANVVSTTTQIPIRGTVTYV